MFIPPCGAQRHLARYTLPQFGLPESCPMRAWTVAQEDPTGLSLFPPRWMIQIDPRRQGSAFAASRPGLLRADPKGRLFMRGKGGCRSASDFVSHLIAFDSHRWRCAQKDTAGMDFRAVLVWPKGSLSAIPARLEPQPRGAVTRRAVAQRREPRQRLDSPLGGGYL